MIATQLNFQQPNQFLPLYHQYRRHDNLQNNKNNTNDYFFRWQQQYDNSPSNDDKMTFSEYIMVLDKEVRKHVELEQYYQKMAQKEHLQMEQKTKIIIQKYLDMMMYRYRHDEQPTSSYHSNKPQLFRQEHMTTNDYYHKALNGQELNLLRRQGPGGILYYVLHDSPNRTATSTPVNSTAIMSYDHQAQEPNEIFENRTRRLGVYMSKEEQNDMLYQVLLQLDEDKEEDEQTESLAEEYLAGGVVVSGTTKDRNDDTRISTEETNFKNYHDNNKKKTQQPKYDLVRGIDGMLYQIPINHSNDERNKNDTFLQSPQQENQTSINNKDKQTSFDFVSNDKNNILPFLSLILQHAPQDDETKTEYGRMIEKAREQQQQQQQQLPDSSNLYWGVLSKEDKNVLESTSSTKTMRNHYTTKDHDNLNNFSSKPNAASTTDDTTATLSSFVEEDTSKYRYIRGPNGNLIPVMFNPKEEKEEEKQQQQQQQDSAPETNNNNVEHNDQRFKKILSLLLQQNNYSMHNAPTRRASKAMQQSNTKSSQDHTDHKNNINNINNDHFGPLFLKSIISPSSTRSNDEMNEELSFQTPITTKHSNDNNASSFSSTTITAPNTPQKKKPMPQKQLITSSIVVEDASDSESEDDFDNFDSVWRNRRPSPGMWIEPIALFQ